MRADRLIQIIMLLQTRGKMTTQTLADELDVSRRTILRDVDALSISGIPIYADGGHGGGVALDENYRSRLTGLKELEALTLFVTDNSRSFGELGLSDAARSSLLKLLATLPTQHRNTVDVMRQRILIDPDWWFHESTPDFWDDLYQAVFNNRQIEMIYENRQGELNERIVSPYSLVSKSSNWYLIARRDDAYRNYRVSRIHSINVLKTVFERQPDFDLPTFWQNQSEIFTQLIDDYHFTIKVKQERLVFIRTLLPGRTYITAEGDGWVTLEIGVMSASFARMLLFELGVDAIVLEPAELKAEIIQQAQILVEHNVG